jgi:hypothetical protein
VQSPRAHASAFPEHDQKRGPVRADADTHSGRKNRWWVDKGGGVHDNYHAMPKTEMMTDVLRRTVRESGLSLYAIAQETGVVRESLSRFMAGTQSLRLDKADKLAAYFKLELRKQR